MKNLAVLCLVLGLCACGDDDGGSGMGATGGDGGDAGSSGTGGSGGTSGSGGTGGTGGSGGTSGTGGASGTGGTSGSGGTAGTAGTGGTGGDAGSAGTGGNATCDDVDCIANATCNETSTGPICVCNVGYSGDGDTCTDIDECALGTDDCPENAVCANTDGGFRCDCDLIGTYAAVLYTEVSWAGAGQGLILDREPERPAALPSFELRTITAQDNGELTVTVEACGGQTADFCIDPQYVVPDPLTDPFPSIAYGQDFPKSLWAKLGTASGTIPLPLASIGEEFLTSDQAAFLGLSLAGDPLQTWPLSRNDPAFTWIDQDEDGTPGVTSMARHLDRNGNPEYDDVGESTECAASFPPLDPEYPIDLLGGSDVTWPYDYWISGSGGGEKVKAFHTGARTISHFNGEITSCDTIEGELVVSQVNARLHGCVTDSDQPCSAGIVDVLDGATDPNTIEGGCFKFMRIAPGSTCADVRLQAFNLLVDGRCPSSN